MVSVLVSSGLPAVRQGAPVICCIPPTSCGWKLPAAQNRAPVFPASPDSMQEGRWRLESLFAVQEPRRGLEVSSMPAALGVPAAQAVSAGGQRVAPVPSRSSRQERRAEGRSSACCSLKVLYSSSVSSVSEPLASSGDRAREGPSSFPRQQCV